MLVTCILKIITVVVFTLPPVVAFTIYMPGVVRSMVRLSLPEPVPPVRDQYDGRSSSATGGSGSTVTVTTSPGLSEAHTPNVLAFGFPSWSSTSSPISGKSDFTAMSVSVNESRQDPPPAEAVTVKERPLCRDSRHH